MTDGTTAKFVAGSPVYVDDHEIGKLEQVIYSPARNQVTAIVVGKGVIFHEDVAIPADLVLQATEDGVRLRSIAAGPQGATPYHEDNYVQAPEQWKAPEGIPRHKVLFAIPGFHAGSVSATGGQASNSKGGAVTIGPGTRVVSHAGSLGHVLAVMVDSATGRATHVTVQSRPLLGRCVIVPLDWASRVTADEIFVEADREQLMRLPEYRPDPEILADVWEALWAVYPIRALELDAIQVQVQDGVVTLKGNVASPTHRHLAVQAAKKVAGVLRVEDQLIADDELETAVARQLSHDELLAKSHIRVESYLGAVTLMGKVSSKDLERRAIELASQVPGVRSVVSNLEEA